MIEYNERLYLARFTAQNTTKELRSAVDSAIVDAFCNATGMVVFEDKFIDVPSGQSYAETGFGHIITVGFDGEDHPLIWFGVTPNWDTRSGYIYSTSRFEYGIVTCSDDGSGGYEYLTPYYYYNMNSSSGGNFFEDRTGYVSSDYAYTHLWHSKYASGGFDVYMTYCKANDGTIAFCLHDGLSSVKNCNNNAFIVITRITDGTNVKHIALQPRMGGDNYRYDLNFSGNEDLGLISVKDNEKRYYNRSINVPTFVTTTYSWQSNSVIERSCIAKSGNGAMTTHRIYLPYEAAVDWYIPEGIIYEALNLNGIPAIGHITQYGNKRLMAVNYTGSGGFRFCINVDAVA